MYDSNETPLTFLAEEDTSVGIEIFEKPSRAPSTVSDDDPDAWEFLFFALEPFSKETKAVNRDERWEDFGDGVYQEMT